MDSCWWLCSPMSDTENFSQYRVAAVYFNGTVSSFKGFEAYRTNGVRPALKLNQSAVSFDSNTNTFSVKQSTPVTVTFKVENGSWNDGTTTDQTVTLTGYEGDPLKLTAEQIPAVGEKPDEGYEAGSWNPEEPDT